MEGESCSCSSCCCCFCLVSFSFSFSFFSWFLCPIAFWITLSTLSTTPPEWYNFEREQVARILREVWGERREDQGKRDVLCSNSAKERA